jgi:regulator of sigma E protease
MSIISIIFAILGLSFLIFIHELGHYFMAKRAGMKIEVFSIGMGKPIFSWVQNGVKWQICYLIFGGYVRIAGMEGENGKEPYEIKGGFYSKNPLQRLLVAGAGPFVNIVFALFLFSVIYFIGGQQKPFSQYTKLIGKVDSSSKIYEQGVRAGDEIISINGKPYTGFKDILIQGMLKDQNTVKMAFKHNENNIIVENVKPYIPNKNATSGMFAKDWKSLGVISSASYVVSNGFIKEQEPFAPLKDSGIKQGDRVVYADGEIIYSISQLADVINKDIAFLTIDRDGKKMHLQVPRVLLGDLKLTNEQKDEFADYKRELDLDGALASTYFIPYLISDGLYIKDPILFIEDQNHAQEEVVLKKGDKILAVNGENIATNEDFYKAITKRKCLIMVSSSPIQSGSEINCDKEFLTNLDKNAIALMEDKIGEDLLASFNGYRFLKPTAPVSYESYLKQTNPSSLENIKKAEDADAYLELLKRNTLFSGLSLKDENISYNPGPFTQAKEVIKDIFFSLKALFTGTISPKHMSGPVGMVKLVHDGTKSSGITGLYWIAMISLNLGFMNLLPIPVLDGGHICFTLYEMITKKRIKAKAMQKMILPFVALIIAFFAYVTFYDLIKVFS